MVKSKLYIGIYTFKFCLRHTKTHFKSFFPLYINSPCLVTFARVSLKYARKTFNKAPRISRAGRIVYLHICCILGKIIMRLSNHVEQLAIDDAHGLVDCASANQTLFVNIDKASSVACSMYRRVNSPIATNGKIVKH